jgi:DNA-binding MarR family transcriptional regulator
MGFYEDISPLHHEVLKTLEKEGTLHISEVAARLLIPRPQMTHLIDKLADLNLVERQIETADRRTIKVTLTDKARMLLAEIDSMVKSNIEEALSSLTDKEMQELIASVTRLREILSKLE